MPNFCPATLRAEGIQARGRWRKRAVLPVIRGAVATRGPTPQTYLMDVPEVRYARSGEVAIAYQTFGDGPIDLVFARGFAGDLLTGWEQPLFVRQLEDFARIARVLMLDKRGTGLSDGFR